MLYVSKNRLGYWLNLFFFVLSLASGCTFSENQLLKINWQQGKARSITISHRLIKSNRVGNLQIRLKGRGTPLLGTVANNSDTVKFTPAIAFRRGAQYEIFEGQTFIARFNIPLDRFAKPSSLVAFHPAYDQLPENLLKVYLAFSAPMREGVALEHLVLADDEGHDLAGIFLDLQPELWNEDRTVLTAWLDPGRIKRDLIPNKKLGNPLKEGRRYQLVIRGGWQDAQGLTMRDTLVHQFTATARDSISPQLSHWRLKLPVTGSLEPLTIIPDDKLDYYLLQESIQITDDGGHIVAGTLRVADGSRDFTFQPLRPWLAGTYLLQADSRLEDLAGNNLERVFDRDLQSPAPPSAVTGIRFLLKP